MNGSKVNEILIDTITQQAEDLEDEDVLQVLSQIETATGTLADTAYAKQKIDEAETNILSKEIRKERKLVWNYNIEIEFEWIRPVRKIGEVYDLTVSWTPQGQNKAREITIPVENFEYSIQ